MRVSGKISQLGWFGLKNQSGCKKEVKSKQCKILKTLFLVKGGKKNEAA